LQNKILLVDVRSFVRPERRLWYFVPSTTILSDSFCAPRTDTNRRLHPTLQRNAQVRLPVLRVRIAKPKAANARNEKKLEHMQTKVKTNDKQENLMCFC
jgi:hypothetical protein